MSIVTHYQLRTKVLYKLWYYSVSYLMIFNQCYYLVFLIQGNREHTLLNKLLTYHMAIFGFYHEVQSTITWHSLEIFASWIWFATTPILIDMLKFTLFCPIFDGAIETESMYVASYKVRWYVHIWYISMNVVRAGRLGQISGTYHTYPNLLSLSPYLIDF